MASVRGSSSVESAESGEPQKEGENHGLASMLTCKKRSQWSNVQYWRGLCPSLAVSDGDEQTTNGSQVPVKLKLSKTDAEEAERRRARLVEDGYVLADDLIGVADDCKIRILEEKLKDGILTLHKKHGYPATFILLFDQTWELARMAQRTLSASTHSSNKFNFDILAWYINPCEGMAGFSPHRDRQPKDVSCSFHKDQQAKYVTMWMALSDANPENSCLYVIPQQYDPGYLAGDDQLDEQEETETSGKENDPMSRALSTKESYQNIRALPRCPGQSVIFSHRIMHWGSRGNPNSHLVKPRIAISFVSSDPEFERPYISPRYFTDNNLPPFRIRLLLVCAQLLIYYQRFDLPKECVRACYEYCKEHGDELDEAYRHKVFVEFVKAMKETTVFDSESKLKGEANGGEKVEQSTGPQPKAKHTGLDIESNNEDDEDAMLEEMLDAEAGGYGEFEDDYDELDDNGGAGVVDVNDGDVESEEEECGSLFGTQDENGNPASKKRKAG